MNKDNLNELKKLLSEISNVIEKYNALNPEGKVSLTKQQQLDTSNMFVCLYNKDCIGLFKMKPYEYYFDSRFIGNNLRTSGSVYIGLNLNCIGAKQTFCDGYTNIWLPAGHRVYINGSPYICNCYMEAAVSFDDIRMSMYHEGLIDKFELGKTTNDEIIDVLNYAKDYFKLSYKNKRLFKKN